jgi:N-acetylmuramoyl-L-alanine amidase
VSSYVYHPRSTWNYLSSYPVTGPLANWSGITTAVIHYTAADDLIDGDPGEHADELPQYLANIQTAYAKPKSQGGRGYSIGYMFAIDWLGGVWQLRGWEYRSAANADHNSYTMPILMLVDGNDPATPEAAAAVRALIADGAKRAGRPTLDIKGHGQLRQETGVGTITSCPGDGLRWQIADGTFSQAPPPPPPPSIIIGEPLMNMHLVEGNVRLLDTRQSGVMVQPGETRTISVGDTTAKAADVTVTAVTAAGAGYASVRPGTSCLNWDKGWTVANTTLAPVTNGTITVEVGNGATHILVDLVALYK